MPDVLYVLADLGRASMPLMWLPLAVWTTLAALFEGLVRVSRVHAVLAVRVRSALLLALPLSVAVPLALRGFAPEAAFTLAPSRGHPGG